MLDVDAIDNYFNKVFVVVFLFAFFYSLGIEIERIFRIIDWVVIKDQIKCEDLVSGSDIGVLLR